MTDPVPPQNGAVVTVRHPGLGPSSIAVGREQAERMLSTATHERVLEAVLGVLARRLGGATFRGTDLMCTPLSDSPPTVLRSGFEIDTDQLEEMLAEISAP